MNKQSKTKLQFILGGIIFLTVAVSACNGGDKDAKPVVKDTPVTEEVKPVVAPATHDSIDTMEKNTGKVSPTPQGN